MTASDDPFDLPGFAPKNPKNSEGKKPYKPREGGSDRPPRRDAAGKPPYRSSGDRGDRPSRPNYGSRDGGSDRPPRREGGDRPYNRPSGDRGDRPPRRDGGDRPSYNRSGGSDRPPRREGGDRPPYRSGGDRDRGERPSYNRGGDRPPRRDFGDRPPRREGGDRPSYNRSGGSDYKPSPRIEVVEISPEVTKYFPLKHEKGRYRESRFLIEGVKNISDVVDISPGIIYTVLVAAGFEDNKLKEALKRHKVHTQEVSARDLASLSDTDTPQGIIAVASFGALKPDWASANTVTLLDGVQDPGNVGAILRTSAALGMDAVVLGKGTCDAYNPKVVRASAAALLRVPLETGEDLAAKIHFLRLKGFSVVATSPHAPITLGQAKLRRKVALLFGNEGAGVGLNFLDQADTIVRIPMRGKVESLNVAVAHGLMTYELSQLRDKR